jgi:hypothetical protein
MLLLLPILALATAVPEGGLFGFGLLPFGGETNADTTAAPAASTTAVSTTALVTALSSTAATTASTNDALQNILDVLTGKATTLSLDLLSGLLGLKNPVPSPLSDPIGFLTHPLITPILLAAVTLNPPALALAMGALAGNLVLTHMFTLAVCIVQCPASTALYNVYPDSFLQTEALTATTAAAL